MEFQVSDGELRVDTQEKDDVEKEDATNDSRNRKRATARNMSTGTSYKKQKRENLEKDDEDEDEDDEDLPRLETRMSPHKLVTLINQLSDTQKAGLKETPFKHFLFLELTKFPLSLAYYVVSNFDHQKSEICVGNERLPVTQKDVEKTLGLSMGTEKIVIPSTLSTKAVQKIEAEWRAQFKLHAKRVTLGRLSSYILKNKDDGGPMFKKNIILYITTALIYCRSNDNVCCDILPYLIDTNRLDEWNWCEFVIDRLKETRNVWRHGKAFNGPLLFLMIHYADHGSACPKIEGWTTTLLNNKQEEWKKGRSRLRDIEKGTSENVDEEKNEGAPDLEILLQTQTPENVDEEKNEEAEMLNDYVKTIEKLANTMEGWESKTLTLMKMIPNHEGMKKSMMEYLKAFNVSISNKIHLEDNPFVIKVGEALTRVSETYLQMINSYAHTGEDKDEREGKEEEEEGKEKEKEDGVENAVEEEDDGKMEEEKDKHQSVEQQVVAGNSNNHGFDDSHIWFSKREREADLQVILVVESHRSFALISLISASVRKGQIVDFCTASMNVQYHSHIPPHVETDHIAKASSLGHKNVARVCVVFSDNTSTSVTKSRLPASHPSNTPILKSKRKFLVLDVNGLLQ